MDACWNDGEDQPRGISAEVPRVMMLPKRTRYRSFLRPAVHHHLRWTGNEADFFLHKQRRFEERSYSFDKITPLPRVLHDSFEIAARQLSTYHWLSQPRSPQEMCARFALDRRLGARPSLAATNRAIRILSRDGQIDTILDIMEDLLVEQDPVYLSTVLEIVNSLQAHPVRAMRVALLLQSKLHAGASISATLWQRLVSDFTRASHGLPKPLSDHHMELLERVMCMVRWNSKFLSEELIVEFGRCLLGSRKPLDSAMRLVQEELLSGRNESLSSSCTLQLRAFLTDLLTALCSSAARSIYDDQEAPLDRVKLRNLLVFSGDVVKYAYAQKVQLAPKAFEFALLLCDACHDYHRLYVLFVSMCVLSVPTLTALLRTVEVVNAIPGIASKLSHALRYSPQDIFVWCLDHFESILAPPRSRTADVALLSFCRALGLCLSDSDPDAVKLVKVFCTVFKRGSHPRYSAGLLCAYLVSRRGRRSTAAEIRLIQRFELVNEAASVAMLSQAESGAVTAPRAGPQHPSWSFLDAPLRAVSGCGEDRAGFIDAILTSALSAAPQAHFSVLDTSLFNSLAANPEGVKAFVGMMNRYASQGGARAIVPLEALGQHFSGLSQQALELVRSWSVEHGGWFAVLPLSLSIQLQGSTCVEVACDLFHWIRRVGHQKVAFMCGQPQVAEAAKLKSVRPVILLEELLQRLTKRPGS